MASKDKIIEIGNPNEKPFYWQRNVILRWMTARFMSLMVARQNGKSRLSREVLTSFIFTYDKRKNPHAIVMAKTANQAYQTYVDPIQKKLDDLPEGIVIRQGNANTIIRLTIRRPWLKDSVTIEFAGSGSAAALRGRTCDLVIADEAAFYKDPDIVPQVLAPTLDATDGLMLVTSTVKGRNYFYTNHEIYRDMGRKGFSSYDAMDYDNYTAQLRSMSWIEEKEEFYRRTGQWHSYMQEYMNDPDVGEDVDEKPFYSIINRLYDERKQGKHGRKEFPSSDIFVVADVGAGEGHSPRWAFIPGTKDDTLHFVGFSDKDKSMFDLIDNVLDEYSNYRIHLVLPSDVNSPSVLDGESKLDRLNRHINKRHAGRRIEIIDLPKTKSRINLIQRGISVFSRSSIDFDACIDGITNLAEVKFKKSAGGEVSKKDLINNGKQHTADSMFYAAAAIDAGFLSRYKISIIQPSEAIGMRGSSYQTGFSRRFPKRRK